METLPVPFLIPFLHIWNVVHDIIPFRKVEAIFDREILEMLFVSMLDIVVMDSLNQIINIVKKISKII